MFLWKSTGEMLRFIGMAKREEFPSDCLTTLSVVTNLSLRKFGGWELRGDDRGDGKSG
jgi:hypothetical protein